MTEGSVRYRRTTIIALAFALFGIGALVYTRPRSKAAPGDDLEVFSVVPHGDLLIVPVSISAKQYRFVIHTGHPVTTLDEIFEPALRPTGKIVRVSANETVTIYEMPTATCGKSQLPVRGDAICGDLAPWRNFTGHDIRGLLGMSILEQYVLRIDFDNGTVGLAGGLSAPQINGLKLSYNPGGPPTVPMDAGDGRLIPFEIDTSSRYSVCLDKETYDSLLKNGLIDDTLTLGTGDETYRVATLRRLRLGEFEHTGLRITEIPNRRNFVGLHYLARYNIVLDFPDHMAYFTKSSRFEMKARFNLAGIKLSRDGTKTVVEDFELASPERTAGVRVGDQLI